MLGLFWGFRKKGLTSEVEAVLKPRLAYLVFWKSGGKMRKVYVDFSRSWPLVITLTAVPNPSSSAPLLLDEHPPVFVASPVVFEECFESFWMLKNVGIGKGGTWGSDSQHHMTA